MEFSTASSFGDWIHLPRDWLANAIRETRTGEDCWISTRMNSRAKFLHEISSKDSDGSFLLIANLLPFFKLFRSSKNWERNTGMWEGEAKIYIYIWEQEI